MIVSPGNPEFLKIPVTEPAEVRLQVQEKPCTPDIFRSAEFTFKIRMLHKKQRAFPTVFPLLTSVILCDIICL
jgi:hypothetical protein